MSFKAGSVYGEAIFDTKKWTTGLSTLTKGAGVAFAAVTAAITAYFVKSIKAASEYQKEIWNVSTLIDTSTMSITAMSKALINMNPQLGTATELSKGLYQAISAGAVTANDALAMTETSAMFAKAALTDMFSAVDVLTTAVNAYGKENMTATQASDLFFETVRLGKITGDQLAHTIGDSISLYAQAKIPLAQLTAGIAAMTKVGVPAAETTTQLNAIVNAFIKPTEQLSAALADMGYESSTAFLEMEGLPGILKLIRDESNGDLEALGELIPNIRALKGVMALSSQEGVIFAETLEAMNKAAGSTQKAFDKQEKTWDTYKNTMANTSIVVGNIGRYFLDMLAPGLQSAAENMLKFVQSGTMMNIVATFAEKTAGAGVWLQSVWEKVSTTVGPMFRDLLTDLAGGAKIYSSEQEKASAKALMWQAAGHQVAIVWGTVIGVVKTVIVYVKDLVLALGLGAKNIGLWFAAMAGKGSWEAVTESQQAFLKAWSDGGDRLKDNFKDIGDAIKKNLPNQETFIAESIALANKWSIETNKAHDKVVNHWDEVTAGTAHGLQELNKTLGDNPIILPPVNLGDENGNPDPTGKGITKKANFIGALFAKGVTEGLANNLGEPAWQIVNSKVEEGFALVTGSLGKQYSIEKGMGAEVTKNYLLELQQRKSDQIDFDEWKLQQRYEQDSKEEVAIVEKTDSAEYIYKDYFDRLKTDKETFDAWYLTQEESIQESINVYLQEEFEKRVTQYQEEFSLVKDIINTFLTDIGTLSSLYYSNELDKITIANQEQNAVITAAYEARLLYIKNLYDTGLITEEEYNTKKKGIEDDYNKAIAALDKDALDKKNALKKKQFYLEQSLAIAEVWVNAASSIAGWWAQAPMLGPIAGPIFAGVMTGIVGGVALAQTVLIASQQFVPETAAEGGKKSGWTILNEEGGELQYLKDGTLVIPNDISKMIASNAGYGNINISFDGAYIDSKMSLKYVAKYVSNMLGKELRANRR